MLISTKNMTNFNPHTVLKFVGRNRNHGIATLWNLKFINPTIEKYNHVGCGTCHRFKACQKKKNVKENTPYCQWSNNRYLKAA